MALINYSYSLQNTLNGGSGGDIVLSGRAAATIMFMLVLVLVLMLMLMLVLMLVLMFVFR